MASFIKVQPKIKIQNHVNRYNPVDRRLDAKPQGGLVYCTNIKRADAANGVLLALRAEYPTVTFQTTRLSTGDYKIFAYTDNPRRICESIRKLLTY